MIKIPNLNIRVDEETYWKFKEAKSKLKAKTNAETLKEMINIILGGEKVDRGN